MITAILLTLSLAACGPKPIKLGIPAPPPERLECNAFPMPDSDIRAIEAFFVGDGIMAYPKGDVDARDAVLAAWIIAIRDAHFSCYDDISWLRNYYQAQDD